MADWTVRELVDDYKAGRLSRRTLVRTLLGAGIGMPLIASILAACGGDDDEGSSSSSSNSGSQPSGSTSSNTNATQAPSGFNPTKRGGGGTLKLIYWQGPTTLNGHLSDGTKDRHGASIFYEPLASIDQEGTIVPRLAAEVPTLQNGGVDSGGKFVVWKLKRGVQWHDGQPFTAEDVVFTYQWITDPETAAFTIGSYKNVGSVDKVDDFTVKVNFKEPTAVWAVPFVGQVGFIVPKHIYQNYKGKEARNAPANLKPVGTGPFKITEFRPNDLILAEINPNYHVENRPYFDKLEMKGGGDANSAAQAVMSTGEYDFAWNMGGVEAEVLTRLEREGKASVIKVDGGTHEHVNFNFTDPNTEVDGERSSLKAPHPFFTDKKVRQAFAAAINKKVISDQLYGNGLTGVASDYWVNSPKKYSPGTPTNPFDMNKANQLLDEAGWRKGSDGIRAKDGKRMRVLFQTTGANPLRQKEQQVIKADLEKLGVQVELKEVDSGVFFGADTSNPDNFNRFQADMQMYAATRDGGPDGMDSFFLSFKSDEACQKANNWAKQNRNRYQNPEFDKLYDAAVKEIDPVKAGDAWKKANALAAEDIAMVPLVARLTVVAAKKELKDLNLSGWESDLWRLAYWNKG